MKNAFSITLNGVVFMIEEDAQKKLSDYFDSIKKYYGDDGEEIMSDIEANIAEKFKEKNKGNQQVVTLEEVEEIIKIMGTVNQIDEEDGNDPVTAEESEGREKGSRRRLYRDSEDVVLAGVCSGLAKYFSVDLLLIRLIFVILTIMNGLGLIIYLVMWLAVPLAKTSMQKLEMQGEPVNLNNIEELVKEKTEQIKKESQIAYQNLKQKKSVLVKLINLPVILIREIVNFFRRMISGLSPAIRIISGSLMLMFFFVGFVMSSFWLANLLFLNGTPLFQGDFPLTEIAKTKAYIITVVSVYLTVLLVLVMVLMLAISIIAKRRIFNILVMTILFVIFTLNVTVVTIFGFDLAGQIKTVYEKYKAENMIEKNIEIEGFNEISGVAYANLILEKADKYSVTARGLKKDVEKVEFILQATSSQKIVNLKIMSKRRNGFLVISEPVEILIKGPNLKRVDVSGFLDYEADKLGSETEIIGKVAVRNALPGQRLGGDRDEHGCIPSAGYSWCESSDRCIRAWEEVCLLKKLAV
ncbi:MAG: hypothetical protein UT64_C0015G0020 [Candidatus Falkowbacteria bacterium GW2011_GWF2_39_8]|uniref:Phage shock protein PspC N-terminal domain-containing protein n=1 Tax=Candidatus Falkowbacteria bacterium GW2011_GWF2_39_8 TaxID=1618642 RepID=A0A0G0PYX3_9BACT|nr:MAG: hypothetical protein UT64_C0015G0020 [Candidatus Falkowbacteria bacterium GW2011_GWF2_39_8]